MFAVYKKELKGYFHTIIGYMFIGLYLILFSLLFMRVFNSHSSRFENMFSYASFMLAFIIPILTMRSFAEERKTGTEQLILTSPSSITGIVIGKFLAATTVVVITTLFTMIYYVILDFFGTPSLNIALSIILGFILLSMSYITFGMFISSLTENQIVAAILPIAFFVFLIILPSFGGTFGLFSLPSIFSSFVTGIISVTEIITIVSFIVLFLLLTIIVMQRRRTVK